MRLCPTDGRAPKPAPPGPAHPRPRGRPDLFPGACRPRARRRAGARPGPPTGRDLVPGVRRRGRGRAAPLPRHTSPNPQSTTVNPQAENTRPARASTAAHPTAPPAPPYLILRLNPPPPPRTPRPPTSDSPITCLKIRFLLCPWTRLPPPRLRPSASRLGWPARFTWQVEEGGSGAERRTPLRRKPRRDAKETPAAGRRPVALMGETHRAKQMEGNTRRETGAACPAPSTRRGTLCLSM
jgi:hypothetical protein